jgi:hypothetical protein
VSLSDSLPAGLTATANNGSVSQGTYLGGTWNVGNLPVSASATLVVEGTVDAGQAGLTISNSTSAAAGSEPDSGSAGDDLEASVRVAGGSGTPLASWSGASGGVSVAANQITYSGTPTGWGNNTVISPAFSTLGYTSDYEVSFTIDSSPGGSTWVVGLGVAETGANWRDIDYGLRSSSGELRVYEAGTWRTTSDVLAVGDVISIAVSPGTLEYRLNGNPFWSTAYAGTPDFYVDTSFNTGAIALSVSVAGSTTAQVATPIDDWVVSTGGVTVAGNDLRYSGTPTGWQNNTAVSAPLSAFGASESYSVRAVIESDPSSTVWVLGLGQEEQEANWRDVDYALRTSNGLLQAYESGTWAATGSDLTIGDVVAIHVDGTRLDYRLNGATFHTSVIPGSGDFYIDSSFKQGAIEIASIELVVF